MSATAANPKLKTRSVKPPASTPGGGKSAAELVRASNRWRDNYNPLRSLVISRVVAMIEAAERGDFAELQLTLRKVEKRYPVLKALIARRCGAIEKLTWDVKVPETLPAGATPAMAEAQRKHLRARYDLVENLTDSFGQLALAEFRGFTLLQKHRYQGGPNDGAVRELHWLPQFNWSRDGQFGDFYWNPDSRFGVGLGSCAAVLGETNRLPLRPTPNSELETQNPAGLSRSDFVFRECDSPLYEIALLAFINWLMGRKDNAAFVEIFGLPNSVVILPPNIKVGEEDNYRTAAEKVADGISGALPNGSDVKFPTASVRGNAPFKEFCDAQDADVVLAGTGGLLTMLSLPQGIGGGASGEHGDAFADIALADARRITAIFQSDFDRVELEEAFPGRPHCAYFELAAQDDEDIKAKLENYGIGVRAGAITPNPDDEAALRESLGLPPMSKDVLREWVRLGGTRAPITIQGEATPAAFGAPVSDPAGSAGRDNTGSESGAPLLNRLLNSELRSREAVRTAFADDLQHALRIIREGLPAILEIEDAPLRTARLAQLVARAKKQVTTAPASADALEELLAAEMAKGLAEKPKTPDRRPPTADLANA